jgi:hypothetical protein
MMRFNDFHKHLVGLLRLEEEDGRRYRTTMLRCYTRGMTTNATLAFMKTVLEADGKLKKPPETLDTLR